MSECTSTSSGGCDPCSQVYTQESIASMLANLRANLFGPITSTVSNGVAVWSALCSVFSSIPGYPRNEGEGFICYILRILPLLAFNHRGVYSPTTLYNAGNIVTYNQTYWYKAKQDTLGNVPTNTTYWDFLIVGPTGPAGSGTVAANDTQVVTVTPHSVLDTEAVLLAEPAANMTFQLDQISAYTPGKWFKFHTNSSIYTVTILPYSGETIGGLTQYVLSYAGSSVELRIPSTGSPTDWRVL